MVKRQTYAGVLMVTLATLTYEVLLTRIFSATMFYHFAFMVISVSMFGMTVGALVVYLLPKFFTRERAEQQLAASALLFAVSTVASFLTFLCIPFVVDKSISMVGLFSLALTYFVIAIPFVFSGLCVCLALTKFPERVGALYAADLAGAAVGCVLLIYVLKITDGPTAVFVVALAAACGTAFFSAGFSVGTHRRWLWRASLACGLSFAAVAAINTALIRRNHPFLRLLWVKGQLEVGAARPTYEKWNAFSRLRVFGDPVNKPEGPAPGFGLSMRCPYESTIGQLLLDIDSGAGTTVTAFNGDWRKLDYLRCDLTNLAHYVRPDSKVLVVGTGGGRDVLSALVFSQKSVTGVEINEDILDLVNRKYGDFTGHLERDPRVRFVNDEARSYVARQPEQYDIIQVSFIDTWAATAAGAFVLTENSLYTTEAWKTFLEKLTPRGVLTFSRWYYPDRPGETYRLTSLAAASLKQMGVENPRAHIIIVKNMHRLHEAPIPDGVATILVSKEPFSQSDLEIVEQLCRDMDFDLVLTPTFALDPMFASLASGEDLERVTASYPLNIAPPTDDSPFFFHTLRLGNMFRPALWQQGIDSHNLKAVLVLGALLVIVVALTLLCIFVPLTVAAKSAVSREGLPHLVYFAAIGLGFMFVEVSQAQRLIIFLGHPTYGLSVVLFALLLSSGIGSLLTERKSVPREADDDIAHRDVVSGDVVDGGVADSDVGDSGTVDGDLVRLSLLLVALALFGFATPFVTHAFRSSTTTIRILIAVGILFPPGLFMGMAFPMGMRIAARRLPALAPWLWGVNGATSICASVVAVAVALTNGISSAFWAGFVCYAVALAAHFSATRRMRRTPSWSRSSEVA